MGGPGVAEEPEGDDDGVGKDDERLDDSVRRSVQRASLRKPRVCQERVRSTTPREVFRIGAGCPWARCAPRHAMAAP